MNVQHIETDTTDETTIDWYSIDGVTYGVTCEGKVLDSDGVPVVYDRYTRWLFEWAANARSSDDAMINKLTDEELIETFEALSTKPETVYMIRSHLDGADPEDCYRAYDNEQDAHKKCAEMTAMGETCTIVAISSAPDTYDNMARIFSTGKPI